MLVHAESAPASAGIASATAGQTTPNTWPHALAGRENLAIAEVIEAARATGGPAHVLHLSSSDALPMIASAPRRACRSASRPARTT